MRAAEGMALAAALVFGISDLPLKAQGTTGESSSVASETTPAWQAAAGGRISFEVASIRRASPDAQFRTNISLNMEDEPIPPGGRFSATASLGSYLALAYKFLPTGPQSEAVFSRLPKWAATDMFTIEAKAPMANPSKDQVRLMMQSLLAERFKLAAHYEAREFPVIAMVLAEPGKLGSGLRPHAQGPPCDAQIRPVDRKSAKIPEVWRTSCGDFQMLDWKDNTVLLGSRDTSIAMFANFLPAIEDPGRPVVDQTGLKGTFDFEINFTPPWRVPKEQAAGAQLDLTGPTFLEALKDQLGLKLKPARASLQTLVIDHIEQPSAN
jgi:bla regulator protein BlaR1